MKMEFRPLSQEDLGGICEIARDTLVPVWATQEYSYFLNHSSAAHWGLFRGNPQELLCFVLALRTGRDLDIVSIACRKEMQKQGLADLLLKRLIQETRCSRVVLEVDVTNEAAIKLYLKNNFVVVGRRKKYYQGKRDAWIMALNEAK